MSCLYRNKKYLTVEELRQLAADIADVPRGEQTGQVLAIILSDPYHVAEGNDREVDVELDKLQPSTLQMLEKYLSQHHKKGTGEFPVSISTGFFSQIVFFMQNELIADFTYESMSEIKTYQV